MMSFQEFFNETASGEKQSKDNRIFFNGINPDRKNVNIVPDVARRDADESANTIDNVIGGVTTSKVVTPDLLQHIQKTYGVDVNNLSQPKTLGNSNVEIYSVRGANGQPIMMLRRKSR
jgi:hypothetical protein